MQCQEKNCTCEINSKLLQPLLLQRKTDPKMLGRIGNCSFDHPDPFFTNIIKSTPDKPPHWNYNYEDSIAIGDIHADFLVLLSILYMMKVIDIRGHFILSTPTLIVFCGDLLDGDGRGCPDLPSRIKNSREEIDILQYLYFLNQEAYSKNKSRIVTVLGNHDAARAMDWGSKFDAYTGSDAAKGWGGFATMKQFFKSTMSQYIARNFPIFVKNRQFIFMHAGISRKALKFRSSIKDETKRRKLILNLNTITFKYISLQSPQDSIFRDLVLPFLEDRDEMNPKHTSASQEKNCRKLLPVAKHVFFGAEGFVFGHTTQPQFQPFCNSSVFRIDFGMSRAFACFTKHQQLGALFIKQILNKDNSLDKLLSYVDFFSCQNTSRHFID